MTTPATTPAFDITYENVDSPFIRSCFEETLLGYPELAPHKLVLRQHSMPKHNMRAQPILNGSIFRRARRGFRLEISNHISFSEHIDMDELPRDVLVGWLAHELGHVKDYLTRSIGNMIAFGIAYATMPTFVTGAERRADLYAIEAGFARQIQATKKYILSHSTLPDSYKQKIERYYMSPDEVALLIEQQEEIVSFHDKDAIKD
ncbi:MAG: hypothetical protein WBA17_03220 [Saprospiraceae bacterium]